MRNQLGDGGATAAMVRQSIDAVAAASGGAIAVHEVPLVIEPRPLAPSPTVTGALAVPALGARTALGDPAWRAWSFTGIARRVTERRLEPLAGGPDPDAVTWPADDDPDEGGADEPAAVEPAAADTPTGHDAAPSVDAARRRRRRHHLRHDGAPRPRAGRFHRPAPRRRPRRRGRRRGATRRPHRRPRPDRRRPRRGRCQPARLVVRRAGPRRPRRHGSADRAHLRPRPRRRPGTADRRRRHRSPDGGDVAARRPAGALRPHPRRRARWGHVAGVADRLDRRRVPVAVAPTVTATCSSTTRRTACTGRTTPCRSTPTAAPVWSRRWNTATTRCRRCCTPSPCTAILAVRLGAAYRPEVHLGGVAYLFLRGMVGDATAGVFSWQPPVALVTGRVRPAVSPSELERPPRRSPDALCSAARLVRIARRCTVNSTRRGARRRFERARRRRDRCAAIVPWTPAGEAPPSSAVVLGAALALWAPLRGHACIDLADAPAIVAASAARRSDADVDVDDDDTAAPDVGALAWPEPARWLEALVGEPVGPRGRSSRPDAHAGPAATRAPRLAALHAAAVDRRVHGRGGTDDAHRGADRGAGGAAGERRSSDGCGRRREWAGAHRGGGRPGNRQDPHHRPPAGPGAHRRTGRPHRSRRPHRQGRRPPRRVGARRRPAVAPGRTTWRRPSAGWTQ